MYVYTFPTSGHYTLYQNPRVECGLKKNIYYMYNFNITPYNFFYHFTEIINNFKIIFFHQSSEFTIFFGNDTIVWTFETDNNHWIFQTPKKKIKICHIKNHAYNYIILVSLSKEIYMYCAIYNILNYWQKTFFSLKTSFALKYYIQHWA